MGNHLWQSTLCLGIAGLLTWVLRKNHARARYGLWLAASVKFLIPFSLLISIGGHLARPRVLPPTEAGFFLAMEQFSQPFTQAATGSQAAEKSRRPAQDAGLRYKLVHRLPAILVAMWLCGFAAVLFVGYARWRRIYAALRAAAPLREGREVEALRRVERVAGIRKRIELLLSPSTLEPGIFGIVRPSLVWPKGFSEHLQDAHLEAILAHEVWHVRRCDNLAAAVHMVVEAIFWFYPLVWWLGARLVDERERACDEQVLEWGSDRQVYAESILKTCEFCVESPLACVSGITSADLKKRIVRIMTVRMGTNLSISRKLLLAIVGMAVVAGPVGFGLVNSPQIRALATQTTGGTLPSFEVASIKQNRSGDRGGMVGMKPGRFTATNETIRIVIEAAYNVRDYQLSGGPSWLNSERYDVDAKMDDSRVNEMKKLTHDQQEQLRLRLRSLLADRFRLRLSHDLKEFPVYALVVAENGPKLQRAKPGDTYPDGIMRPSGLPAGPHTSAGQRGQLTVQALPMASVARLLSLQLGCHTDTILDKTGLRGDYDLTLQWTPDESQTQPCEPQGINNAPPPQPFGPSIFTALQEQLGLKLEPTKGPVEMLVIDHIEKPSEN